MAMKPSLQVRLSQHLALTPQLQQSIRLLQLSTLELHHEVEQMLDENPFLETEEEAATDYDAPLPDRVTAVERDDAEGDGEPPEIDAEAFGTTGREDWENGTEGDDFDGIRETPAGAGSSGDGNASDEEGRDAATGSLTDHLHQQLAGLRLSAEDRAAVRVLIESLDGDGYLADTLEEIAARLAGALEVETEDERDELMARLRLGLRWLQNLDPVGIGARTLSECLTLQLQAQPPSAAQPLAIVLCERHLELLARRDLKRIAAITGADDDLVREAQSMIVACDPRPGRAFDPVMAAVVVPDVLVLRNGRGLKVMLNPEVLPRLRINDVLAMAARGARNGAGNGLSSRLQEARWFMKNIQQRFDTILRVSQAIVERQKGFFAHGAIAMKPLVLREIGDELGLHESTISRVTTAKYMATPNGTFELKYFFGSSLATETGGSTSSTAVRALIQQIVAAENPRKPLSDSQISKMLEEQGIQVARRTVAKYRDELKIAPTSLRRAH